MTPRQREVLVHRIARAIRWKQSQAYERDNANFVARAVVDELEFSFASAPAQRRAVASVLAAIDDAASLRSVSPVEREAQPVADATELGSEAAS